MLSILCIINNIVSKYELICVEFYNKFIPKTYNVYETAMTVY